MRQRWKWILGGIVLFVAGFYAGGYVGAHRLWAVLEPLRQTEAEAAVNFGLDELLWLRTDRPEQAFWLLETRLDWAIHNLSRQGAWEEMSAGTRRSLLTAKKYRARFPFDKASPEAQAALAAVPDEPLDAKFLNSATRLLAGAAEPTSTPAELAKPTGP